MIVPRFKFVAILFYDDRVLPGANFLLMQLNVFWTRWKKLDNTKRIGVVFFETGEMKLMKGQINVDKSFEF